MTGRTVQQRKADVLAAIGGQKDLWIATADLAGRPHLIAVSAWWDGSRVVIATTDNSRTARNLVANHSARLALGAPDDVVMIDVRSTESRPVSDSAELAGGFAAAVGWDPREVGKGWVFFALVPERIQAYRGYDELEGREVMRNSRWLA
ncbi:MAG TPA: pyridoxamine 5'-phosphate oxidase family protein [Candidatus Dormibacteraeota bacterium]|nr:pyridoxamine 5'-phosphate oxidase family protein [Candidatus Dormibacteraeota bacterium]